MPPSGPLESDSPAIQLRRATVGGLLITLAQIVFACAVGVFGDGGGFSFENVQKAYRGLAGSESLWYRHIAENGYDPDAAVQAGKQGNVAFFPAYPLLVRGIHSATGLPWDLCLLFASQLACWGFWTYFLLLLDRHNVPILHARLIALFLMSLPASFFLIAGYSESLLLFSMLGFIYWTGSENPALRWLGVAHGVVMTATQFIGLPVVIYPIVNGFFRPGSDNGFERLIDSVLLAVVASLGAFGFFVFCQYHFGAWDLAMTSQERGWNVRPNYLALFDSETYLLDVELWQTGGFISSDWLSRAIVPLLALAFVIVLVMEVYLATTQPSSTAFDRIGYYVAALSVFAVAACALFGNQYRSMIRAVMPAVTLLAVYLADLLSNEDVEGVDAFTVVLAFLVIVPSFIAQGVFLHQFLDGDWVA